MVYDAIIVGTGSAGGILADRLTDGTGKQVLVLEAGPDFETMYPGTDPADERSRLRSVRANCTQHSMDTFHWTYTDSSGNQIPYGKNVGGSGSHNGMQSYRATRLQHSLWPAGWHYNDFAPYYDADRITTPLIIFHGDADTAVPVHHGWMPAFNISSGGKAPSRVLWSAA